MSEKKSYQEIMKATSIFGGVQVFGILIAIIRSKFIAVLLGPIGIGVSGLLTSTTGLISGITNFGLGSSAIKNVSSVIDDNDKISEMKYIVDKWFKITGLFGFLVTILLSPILSKLTFGSYEYTYSFLFLSITLLINQLANFNLVFLQGLRKVKELAQSNLLASILGLATIPIYFWLKLDGIVLAIIASSIISLLVSGYYSKKIEIKKTKVLYSDLLSVGKQMLKLGFVISFSNIITILASYIIRIYIGNLGGIEHVGLFNAGFAIVNSYVGLVFTAMATDYFPRLSSVSGNQIEVNKTINQQAEIALLIISPIVIIFIIFINNIIVLLYSDKFVEINGMIKWFALGMLFKAFSWAIAYIFLAKGDSKTFFKSELLANIYILIFNILGYKYLGLEGLGISFAFGYLIYLLQVYYISKSNYGYKINSEAFNVFIIQTILTIACFCFTYAFSGYQKYIFSLIIFILSSVYSIIILNRKIDLFSTIANKIRNGK